MRKQKQEKGPELRASCRYCGAPPGQPCKKQYGGGGRAERSHVVRFADAMPEAQKKEAR